MKLNWKTFFTSNLRGEVFAEIRGRKTVIAEGFFGLLLYSGERVLLGSAEERISIEGKGLELKHMSRGRIAVDGRIDKVEFL